MRRLRSRSGRREAGTFIVEGPQALREAIDCTTAVRSVFATAKAAARHADLIDRARASGVDIVLATGEVIEAIAETDTPQGLVAECSLLDGELDAALRPGRISVALEAVGDPGNAGTVIRTADAVGAAGVVLTAGSVDPHNGKCVRATAGSLFHLPVASEVALGALHTAAGAAGLVIAAATGDGEVDLFDWIGSAPAGICWLLGSEAHGLSPQAREIADVRLRIPMSGQAESLNVATAAAICLFADRLSGHDRMSSR